MERILGEPTNARSALTYFLCPFWWTLKDRRNHQAILRGRFNVREVRARKQRASVHQLDYEEATGFVFAR